MKKTLSLIAIATLFATSAFAAETAPASSMPEPQAAPHHEGHPPKSGDKAKHEAMREKRMNHYQDEFFKRMDKNGDGKVTKEEYLNEASAQFDKMDMGKKGSVTKEEVSQYMKEKQKEHHDKRMEEMKEHREHKANAPKPAPDAKPAVK